jgi:hypothetical protein
LSQAFNTVAGLNARALFRVRASSWVPPTSGDAAAGTVWLIGELDYKTRRELSWSSGGEADVAVVGVDGSQVLSKTLQVPAADGTFAIRIPDAGTLAPGEYAVRVRVRPQADPSLPVSDIARVQVPSTTSPIGEAVLWRRGPSTGLRYSMTADPRFMRTERVRLELPTRLTTTPTARLLDRAGKPISVPVQVTERTDAGADFHWVVADVQLAPLAAGDYAIEVTVDRAKQVTGFRVVP